ncbi:GLUT4 regulating protein TUG-domain-containing protein [Sordaria sp. MPI-SDFR-AT-0083]|nr:GLUT4 regulating protein TUG-domain-containing protein [Sordaria sp. MPI-SDFR-AT-0083]
MSAHVEVVSTDLRRTKVKVTPGTYLVDVLGEACQKFNLNSDKYQLKHKQKLIDLSGPFRTSGLVSGAKLELVQKSKSAAVVSIALDVNGQRYTKKLSSDMMLWQVMRQFEVAEQGLNLTGRGTPKSSTGPQGTSGQLYFEAPVVNIMGRDYTSMEDLQKTLSQCGINSGSIVLRVSFRDTDKTLYDAMQDIGQYLKEVEPSQPKTQTGEPSAPATGSAPAIEEPIEDLTLAAGPKPVKESTLAEPELQVGSTEAAKAVAPVVPAPEPVAKTDPMDIVDEVVPAPPVPPIGTTTTIASEPSDPLEPTGVFNAPSSTTPLAARVQVDDAVYEPTIAHAQLRQQQLLQRAQNQRLKSDAELAADAAEEAARLAKITSVDIKVRFPDQTSAQWTVTPEQTGSFLYQAVKGVMAHPDQPFRLILPGTHPIVAVQDGNKRLVADYKLRGRALLNLVWDDAASEEARKSSFLKGSVASRAQEVVVPDVSQVEGEDDKEVQAGPSSSGQEVKRKGDHGLDSDAVKKKLGKLFKLPGRK